MVDISSYFFSGAEMEYNLVSFILSNNPNLNKEDYILMS